MGGALPGQWPGVAALRGRALPEARATALLVHATGLASPTETVTPVFQELRLSGNMAGSSGRAAELLLPSGLTVRLRDGAASEWVGALVQALGGSCSR